MKSLTKLILILLLAVPLACGGPAPQEAEAPPAEAPAPSAVPTTEAPAVAESQSALRVGVSSATVNPDAGTFLGGYDQNRKCTGVHDDLFAKAIAFDDGETTVVLCVVDSLGIQYDTVQAIRDAAAAKASFPRLTPERVVVVSTHTHCSPDVIGIYGPEQTTTGRDAAYMQKLVDTCAAQVAKAVENLQPGTLVQAEAKGGDWRVNDSEPGVVDEAATILQCRDALGTPIATLTAFACHPTVLDGDTTLASSDWVGTFYKDMAAAVPGEHLYLQGGVGGWVQPKAPHRTFEVAGQYGSDLAERVIAALPNAQPVQGSEVRFAHNVFGMPNENEMFRQISADGLNLIPRTMTDTIETEVAWFSVGDAQFATHPGETAPAFTWQTEELMDTGPKFVLGLGLDELGYILKPEYFDQTDEIKFAEYLTAMSPGRESGPAMMAALGEIIP
ncbi:MAG: alkaline ceramidase [bacterium]|nr:alkaline ceramidase [bacterium]